MRDRNSLVLGLACLSIPGSIIAGCSSDNPAAERTGAESSSITAEAAHRVGTSANPATPAAEAAPVTVHATAKSAALETATTKRKEWRRLLSKTHATKPGCFHASEPSTTWEEVPCGPAPAAPHRIPEWLLATASASTATGVTPFGGPRLLPELINGVSDYNASVSGLLLGATGTFPLEVGGTNESDNSSAATKSGSNSYTVQLNTNRFTSAACNGQSNCQGWEQFIYEPLEQKDYIEFSLVGYSGSCPDDFPSSYTTNGTQVCYFNTDYNSPAAEAASNLSADIELTGSTYANPVGVPTDYLDLMVAGQGYELIEYSELGLANGWTDAEFNVYGDNNSTQATFNSATTLEVQVQTIVQGGSAAAPTCAGSAGSGTAESNNLYLNGACCAFGGPDGFPGVSGESGIRFTESTVPGAAASFVCPSAPNCSYTFACTGAGEVSVTCTPDGNSPSDPITIYHINGGQNAEVAEYTFSSTSSARTQVATLSTLSSGLAETFVGCTSSSWGLDQDVVQVCDPTPTTISTPSCVGQPCGTDGTYNASGQCISPCQPATCSTLGKDCGTWANGCGGDVTCGTCASSMVCQTGVCVGSGGSGGTFCTNCRKTGGVCSTSGGSSVCIHE